MYWFAIASLSPAFVLLAACLFGGVWAWVALFYCTGFVVLADQLGHNPLPERDGGPARVFARRLNVALVLAHFILLPVGVRAIATSPDLTLAQGFALAPALGLYLGQVSNSNAHELIHAPGRRLRALGVMVYVSLLFGHHASAHPKVHHVHVATSRDPNSAPLGQGFYAFWPRAWIGSFRAGLRAETAARARLPVKPNPLDHAYVTYAGGAALALFLAWWLAGPGGIAIYLALTGHAQMQLILADYVQHYGLRRRVSPDGRVEPAGARHSWNAPHWYSGAMMLNAPRHSDHHMHPLRPLTALRLDGATMAILPFSLPVMAAIALFPPLWRKIMDPRVARWQVDTTAGGARQDDLSLSAHANDPTDSPDPGSADDGHADGGANCPDGGRV